VSSSSFFPSFFRQSPDQQPRLAPNSWSSCDL
jgi:hypothetical protein